MSSSDSTHPSHSRPFLVYLVFTSVLCGALVMVTEVLGSMVIGPFFGASLFVWTSLITVTLVGLASGYSIGGMLSDRRPSPDYLYGLIGLAGIFIILVPLLKRPVLEATIGFGLRLGALCSSGLLFGPPLFLLGCVSPYIIKIAAREMRSIGRTVGIFSAISTMGSFFGTLLTGFVLIAYFPVDRIFLVAGSALILITISYFLYFRRKWLALLLVIVPLLVPAPRKLTHKVLSDGTEIRKLSDKDTFYGAVKVFEYKRDTVTIRQMYLDLATMGAEDTGNGMSVGGYYYFLQYMPVCINPNGTSCLVIGLGPGSIPAWYGRRGVRTDVVDINPEVFAAARKYFGFRATGEEFVGDARYFLNSTSNTYDYVILDVFSGDSTPVHVLSRESLQMIARVLNKGGVLGINLLGNLQPGADFMTASVVKTLKEVFATVDIYPTFDPRESNDGIGNIILLAYNGPPAVIDNATLSALPYHPLAMIDKNIMGTKFNFPPNTPAITLTDNYNPIEFYDLKTKEKVRMRELALVDLDLIM